MGQTDRQTDGWIAALLNAPVLYGGCIIRSRWHLENSDSTDWYLALTRASHSAEGS